MTTNAPPKKETLWSPICIAESSLPDSHCTCSFEFGGQVWLVMSTPVSSPCAGEVNSILQREVESGLTFSLARYGKQGLCIPGVAGMLWKGER